MAAVVGFGIRCGGRELVMVEVCADYRCGDYSDIYDNNDSRNNNYFDILKEGDDDDDDNNNK